MSRAEVIELAAGSADRPLWLDRAEALHRDFRPHIPGAYRDYMDAVLANGGEMAVAAVGDRVVGIAVYRLLISTFGRRLYVDDLVVDETERSSGHGRLLLDWCEAEGRRRGAHRLDLESGTWRARAHRFYFREGMTIFGFSFNKPLNEGF
ncbi:GNAT family N-acetyltransferase [Brevundimonas sp.]|uniref:GNAT family N-acetyltransferase n=1 Tax=Brevundimonas sp. TaxID=1871086 RepID=UPI002FC8EB60